MVIGTRCLVPDKILVPLDGSKHAEAVLHHVADMAQRYHAKVMLLPVHRSWRGGLRHGRQATRWRMPASSNASSAMPIAILTARCSEFRGEGITAEFRIGHGDVVPSHPFRRPKRRASIWWRWPAMAGAGLRCASSSAAWRRASA